MFACVHAHCDAELRGVAAHATWCLDRTGGAAAAHAALWPAEAAEQLMFALAHDTSIKVRAHARTHAHSGQVTCAAIPISLPRLLCGHKGVLANIWLSVEFGGKA